MMKSMAVLFTPSPCDSAGSIFSDTKLEMNHLWFVTQTSKDISKSASNQTSFVSVYLNYLYLLNNYGL